MTFRFELLETDGKARRGRMHTTHGSVETPVFMAVGTQATVKGLTPQQLDDAGVQMLLGNTYHLTLRPGDELIAELGGLHKFMGWQRPILTDSGGYQIYSLAANLKIDDRAAVFRSHIDGSLLELTPEKAVRIQENLGSDIAMCLDECPPFETPAEYRKIAVERTLLWAERCRAAHRRADQALFAIVQGGTDIALRIRCAQTLTRLDFPGYALGGFAVGETMQQMVAALEPCRRCAARRQAALPHGRGSARRFARWRWRAASTCSIASCRRATAAMPRRSPTMGRLKMRNSCHKRDSAPLESDCPCLTCREFSRAYLHHLFLADEMLGPTLLSLHNLAFYNRLMAEIRLAIAKRRFASFCQARLARWGEKI